MRIFRVSRQSSRETFVVYRLRFCILREEKEKRKGTINDDREAQTDREREREEEKGKNAEERENSEAKENCLGD